MRPARIALPLLAAGYLLVPDAARAQARRTPLQTGIDLMQKGRESEALAIFRKLTEEDTTCVEAWNNRAALEASLGDLESARISLERALAARPEAAMVNRNLEKVRSRLARMAYDSAFGTRSKLPPLMLDLQRQPLAPIVDSTASRQRDSLAKELARIVERNRRDLSRKDSAVSGLESEIQRLRSELERAKAEADSAKSRLAAAPKLDTPQAVVAMSEPPPRTPPAQTVVPQPPAAPKAPERVAAETKTKPVAKAPLTADAVLAALQNWAKAWSDQDVDGYLSCYSDRFTPAGKLDREAWVAQRRERISAPNSIKVEIVGPKVRMLKDRHAEVVYRQIYQTEDVRLTSRKRLEFAWERGVWRIFAEKEAR
ncbi:MAG TPA: hypothetical protein PK208_08290 [Fibrobacteria bacterium]|nr:hypothetical protein [Fibrobacteria bacterium]